MEYDLKYVIWSIQLAGDRDGAPSNVGQHIGWIREVLRSGCGGLSESIRWVFHGIVVLAQPEGDEFGRR
jgi:hypothetical protein